jgi:hypothetical protein
MQMLEYGQKHILPSSSPVVDAKQNAIPPRHDDAIVPRLPASGSESKTPMVNETNLVTPQAQIVH